MRLLRDGAAKRFIIITAQCELGSPCGGYPHRCSETRTNSWRGAGSLRRRCIVSRTRGTWQLTASTWELSISEAGISVFAQHGSKEISRAYIFPARRAISIELDTHSDIVESIHHISFDESPLAQPPHHLTHPAAHVLLWIQRTRSYPPRSCIDPWRACLDWTRIHALTYSDDSTAAAFARRGLLTPRISLTCPLSNRGPAYCNRRWRRPCPLISLSTIPLQTS